MSTSADEPLDASIPGISIILSDAVAMPIAAEMGEQPALAAIASLSADLKAALGRMVGTVENRIANSSVCVDEIERACAQFAEVRLFGLDSDGVRAVSPRLAANRLHAHEFD